LRGHGWRERRKDGGVVGGKLVCLSFRNSSSSSREKKASLELTNNEANRMERIARGDGWVGHCTYVGRKQLNGGREKQGKNEMKGEKRKIHDGDNELNLTTC